MKKLFVLPLLLILFGLSNDASAQKSKQKLKPMIYECYYRELCAIDPETGGYDICEGYDEISTFYLAKDRSEFLHITETIESTYYVNDHDIDSGIELFDVTSDAGNDYIMGFDAENKVIGTFLGSGEDEIFMKFYVKEVKKGKYKGKKKK